MKVERKIYFAWAKKKGAMGKFKMTYLKAHSLDKAMRKFVENYDISGVVMEAFDQD